MAMYRLRPFKDEQQYYTYAWFFQNTCIYAGYGHADRCRHVRYKLSSLLQISVEDLTQKAHLIISAWGSKKSAQIQERYWIKVFQPKFCIAPGCGSWPGFMSAEGRANLSKVAHERKWTPAQRETARQRMLGNTQLLGHKHSPETRQKLSDAGKGRAVSLLARKKAAERCRIRNVVNPPMLGRMFSVEHRQKLSKAARIRSRRETGQWK